MHSRQQPWRALCRVTRSPGCGRYLSPGNATTIGDSHRLFLFRAYHSALLVCGLRETINTCTSPDEVQPGQKSMAIETDRQMGELLTILLTDREIWATCTGIKRFAKARICRLRALKRIAIACAELAQPALDDDIAALTHPPRQHRQHNCVMTIRPLCHWSHNSAPVTGGGRNQRAHWTTLDRGGYRLSCIAPTGPAAWPALPPSFRRRLSFWERPSSSARLCAWREPLCALRLPFSWALPSS